MPLLRTSPRNSSDMKEMVLFVTACACTLAVWFVFLDTAHAQDCDNPLVITSYSSEEIRFPVWKWTRAKNDATKGERYFLKSIEVCDGKADAYVACIRSKPDAKGEVEENCSIPSDPFVIPEPGQDLQLLAGLAALAGMGWRRR